MDVVILWSRKPRRGKRRHGIYDRQNAGSLGLQSRTFIILYVGGGISWDSLLSATPRKGSHLFFTCSLQAWGTQGISRPASLAD